MRVQGVLGVVESPWLRAQAPGLCPALTFTSLKRLWTSSVVSLGFAFFICPVEIIIVSCGLGEG